MKTETLPSLKMEVEDIDYLGRTAQRFDFCPERVIIPLVNDFIVPVYNLETGEDVDPIPTVSFAEFALKLSEGSSDKYVSCLIPDKDGELEPTDVYVKDWIQGTYYPDPDEPYIPAAQRRLNKQLTESTLLNIIESKY